MRACSLGAPAPTRVPPGGAGAVPPAQQHAGPYDAQEAELVERRVALDLVPYTCEQFMEHYGP
eukprot:4013631-Alexandrium_andersonii.AAC.1